jgi:transcriptional regulator with XRE-family HTH domain
VRHWTLKRERGWSLAELAKRARISRPTLAQALRGQHVRPSTAYKLAVALSNAEVAPALPGILGDS